MAPYQRGYVMLDAHGPDQPGEIRKRVLWVFGQQGDVLDIAFKTLGEYFSLRLHVVTSAFNAGRISRAAEKSPLFTRLLDPLEARECPFVSRSNRADRYDFYFDAMDNPEFFDDLTWAPKERELNVCYLSGAQYIMPLGILGYEAHMIVECPFAESLDDLVRMYGELEEAGRLRVSGPYSHRERVMNGRARGPGRRRGRDAA
jgi:hypothetical protein